MSEYELRAGELNVGQLCLAASHFFDTSTVPASEPYSAEQL